MAISTRLRGRGQFKAIYVVYRFEGREKAFNTGEKIEERHFFNGQATEQCVDHDLINENINTTYSRVRDCIRTAKRRSRTPSIDLITSLFEEKPELGELSVLEAFKKFKESKAQKASSCKGLNGSIENILKNYEEYTGEDLTWKSFNQHFFYSFLELTGKGKIGRDMTNISLNTSYQYLSRISTFVNWARTEEYHYEISCLKWKSLMQKKKKVSNKQPNLRNEEVDILIGARDKFEGIKGKVLNAYLLQMFTGSRYSDIRGLKWVNIDFENRLLVKYSQKTSGKINIGINDLAMEIINKYLKKRKHLNANVIVDLPSSTSFAAKQLKSIFKTLGLNRPVRWISQNGEGFKIVEELKPLYDVVGTHSARHTFATRYMNEYKNPRGLQTLLGHSSIETTMRYDNSGMDALNAEVKALFGQ